MALGDSYASPADLELRLGQADDGRYGAVLGAASRGIELFVGRQFNRVDTASGRRYSAVDPIRLPTDDFHTTDDLAVDVDGEIWDVAQVDPRPWDGVVNGQTGWPFFDLFSVDRCWPRKTRGRRALVTVTARWGWTAVPEAIKEATLILAERYYRRPEAPWGAAWNVSGIGDVEIAKLVSSDPDVVALTELYMLPRVIGV